MPKPARSLIGLLLVAISCGAAARAAGQEVIRPNIILILMDDLRWDDLACAGNPVVKTPNIDRVAREGARFTNAFATTPLCSPSRASFLTGRYPHAHGIVDNTDRSLASHRLVTFPLLLHEAGYETGYIGKWHMGVDDTRRPGFDDWLSIKGQGTYIDPELNDNGRVIKETGYTTDIFNRRAVAFLKRPRQRPFLLFLAHKAVHPELMQFADGRISDPNGGTFLPAARHRSLYAGLAVPRRASVTDTLEGKPALQRSIEGLPPLGPRTGTDDEMIRNRWRMLAAADEGVGEIFQALRETGQLDDTILVFTSDHGYFYGEHGLSHERRLAYEESTRIPLLVRYPRLIRPGVVLDPMVLSIDLAPTLLELGGAPVPENLTGRSLVPLLAGRPWQPRESFLIEYFSDSVFPRIKQMGYQTVRTERWKLIHYTELNGMDELYDLRADPFELHNLIAEPSAQDARQRLDDERRRLLKDAR